ncbi:beta-glucuronidase [Octopus bimaculoides]|uniref:beta-glucuronidase n=1 Tax=Octopus bimaculoides TaxID=37653 RepID=UPI0022E840B1|nr:beta-glucuronidase [Octopus bimaculoides]
MASVMFSAPSSGSQFHLVIYLLVYLFSLTLSLRVQDSETRQVRCLSGMWNFRADYSAKRTEGFKSKWYSKPLWQWVNSEFAFNHSGGHLPFEGDVTHLLKYDRAERVTVAVNNTLSPTTLPPGTITYKTDSKRYPKGYFVQNLQMDFFNYAGIHRNVWLYATPQTYIMNIYIDTSIQKSSGIVTYEVIPNHYTKGQRYKVKVINEYGNLVASSNQSTDVLKISNANFWWPYTMNTSSPAYLYTMEVTLISDTVDIYRHPFGIRTVKVNSRQLLINDQPFYCLGVGRHEDADVRGKGVDLPFIAKDFNLMKWLGVNCFRTSHYPYSEELMDEADRQGFAVIDESPGVGIEKNNMEEANLIHHKNVMLELVDRDKNRPSVIIWSVANEPSSYLPKAEGYFKSIIRFTQMLDKSRPVTFVMNANVFTDKAAQFADILCINRYFGWYSDMGHPEVVPLQLPYELDNFHALHRRPVILTEYGADTVNGLHRSPSIAFTEEYQVNLLTATHEALDKRIGTYMAGEMVWNFADFQTDQGNIIIIIIIIIIMVIIIIIIIISIGKMYPCICRCIRNYP